MNTKTKRVGTVTSAVAAVGLIVGGAWGIGAAVATPEPEPTSVVEPANLERPASDFTDTRPDVTPTPEPTEAAPVVEPAPAEPAPAPAQPAPAQPAPAPPVVEPAPAPAPPPPPVTCPAGSVSAESDGYNDTSCTWEVCYTLTLPDPSHPECDANFRP